MTELVEGILSGLRRVPKGRRGGGQFARKPGGRATPASLAGSALAARVERAHRFHVGAEEASHLVHQLHEVAHWATHQAGFFQNALALATAEVDDGRPGPRTRRVLDEIAGNAATEPLEEWSWSALLHPRVAKGRKGGGQFRSVLGQLAKAADSRPAGRRTPATGLKVEVGGRYRDENDYLNRWVRVVKGPDRDGFYRVEPLDGSAPYTVYGGSLTPNARLSRAQVDTLASSGNWPPRPLAGRATPATLPAPKAAKVDKVKAALKPGGPGKMGDLPDGTVIATPDGRVGILRPSEGKPSYGDKQYVVAYDIETGQKFEPPAWLEPAQSSTDPAVRKDAEAALKAAKPEAPPAPPPQAPSPPAGPSATGQVAAGLEKIEAAMKPGGDTLIGDLPDGTVIGTPDGMIGVLKPSEGKPSYDGKEYVVAYDVATGQQFEPPAWVPPTLVSTDPKVKKQAQAMLDAAPPPQAPQAPDMGGLAGLLQQLTGQGAPQPQAPPKPGAKATGASGLPGDLSVANPAAMEARAQAVTSLLQSGKSKKDAVLELIGPNPAREERIKALTSGDLDRALKEYRYTPLGDLQVLSGIDVRSTPIQGQAVCHMDTRSVAMGSTSNIGDFRHELGHAIRASTGGAGGFSAKTALSAYIAERHQESLAKAQEGAATVGKQDFPPGAEGNALKQAFYEEHFGVIDPRSLDNWEEDFAEHYRAYQKAIYQSSIVESSAPDHDAGALAHYRDTFPKWADFWDAWYTAQLEGSYE
jgi:hypothetical protein